MHTVPFVDFFLHSSSVAKFTHCRSVNYSFEYFLQAWLVVGQRYVNYTSQEIVQTDDEFIS